MSVLNAELPADRPTECYDYPVDQPQNIAYLRGVRLRPSDFVTNPGEVPDLLLRRVQ